MADLNRDEPLYDTRLPMQYSTSGFASDQKCLDFTFRIIKVIADVKRR